MDMITIDIGNSTISLAVFAQQKLSRVEQVEISEADTRKVSSIISGFRELCGPQPLGAKTVPVVASSVNPTSLELVEEALGQALNQNLLLIGRDFPLEMKVALADYDTLGSDRLLSAFAAYSVVEGSVVVADFGTATTIDCVNEKGIFLGGVILPGLNLCAQSLNDYAAALPKVQPVVPQTLFGVDTETSIQNGIYYGTLGALREVVERFAEYLGHWPQVVATGGFSRMIAQECNFIDSLVPDLCLNGLYLAYRRFRESTETKL